MPEPTQVTRFNEAAAQAYFEQGLKKVYHNEIPVLQNEYKAWLREETATEWFTTEHSHSTLGVMPEKQIGARFSTDRIYYGSPKTYEMVAYGLSLVVQYEVIRWDLYKVFLPITKSLARTAVTRYDLVAYGIFNNGFSTANSVYTDYRGEALFSTSHTRMDGGTWQNRSTTDVGLSMGAIQDATTILRKTPDTRGNFTTDLQPKLLITTVENDWLADTLLKSRYNPDNANQQYNNLSKYTLTAHTCVYITTSTAWFLACSRDSYKIKMDHGDKPDLVKDSEPGTRNMIFTSYMSFRLNVYESRGLFGSQGV